CFVPETHQLVAIVHGAPAQGQLLVWDLASGREQYRNNINPMPDKSGFATGEVFAGPTPDTLLLSGTHPAVLRYAACVIDPRSGNVVHALPYALRAPPSKGRALALATLGTGARFVPGALGKFKNDGDRGKVLFDTKFDAGEAAAATTTLTKVT